MKGKDSVLWRTKQRNEITSCKFQNRTGQTQVGSFESKQTTQPKHSSKLAYSTTLTSSHHTLSIVPMLLVLFFLVSFLSSPTLSHPIGPHSGHTFPANQTLRPGQELHKLKRVNAYLKKVNKPAVKTIQAFSFSLYMK